MTPEEKQQLQNRITQFENGNRDLQRFKKLAGVLDALDGGDHDIGCIVIDVRDRSFRYRSEERRDRNQDQRICSLEEGDHGDMFHSFLKWAKQEVAERIAIASRNIKEA